MTKLTIYPALLTKTEIEWLMNNLKISKAYEYRIKSDIRKKLKTFTELEIPFLMKKGIIDNIDLSVFTQNLRTNPQTNNYDFTNNATNTANCVQNMVGREGCNTELFVIYSKVISVPTTISIYDLIESLPDLIWNCIDN